MGPTWLSILTGVSNHYTVKGSQRRNCVVCSTRQDGTRHLTLYRCGACPNTPTLCPALCFQNYHTQSIYQVECLNTATFFNRSTIYKVRTMLHCQILLSSSKGFETCLLSDGQHGKEKPICRHSLVFYKIATSCVITFVGMYL